MFDTEPEGRTDSTWLEHFAYLWYFAYWSTRRARETFWLSATATVFQVTVFGQFSMASIWIKSVMWQRGAGRILGEDVSWIHFAFCISSQGSNLLWLSFWGAYSPQITNVWLCLLTKSEIIFQLMFENRKSNTRNKRNDYTATTNPPSECRYYIFWRGNNNLPLIGLHNGLSAIGRSFAV